MACSTLANFVQIRALQRFQQVFLCAPCALDENIFLTKGYKTLRLIAL
jgi:hypothetical protein